MKQEVTYALVCQLSEPQRDALKKLGEEFGVTPGQMGTRLISDELIRMGLLPVR